MQFLTTKIWWVALIAMVLFIFLYKKLTKRKDAITSKFFTQKNIKGSFNDNIEILEQALKNTGFKKVHFNKAKNKFFARTKFSMSSFSEFIELKLHDKGNETEIEFKSICALPTQVYDWGKNKRNYRKFEKQLEMLI